MLRDGAPVQPACMRRGAAQLSAPAGAWTPAGCRHPPPLKLPRFPTPSCLTLQQGRPYASLIQLPAVRAVRAREAAPALQRPAFSSCTLPIVWLPDWAENFYHAYLGEAGPVITRAHCRCSGCTPHAPLLAPSAGLSAASLKLGCCR